MSENKSVERCQGKYLTNAMKTTTSDRELKAHEYMDDEHRCTSALELIALAERIFFGLGDTVWAKRVYSKAKGANDFNRLNMEQGQDRTRTDESE